MQSLLRIQLTSLEVLVNLMYSRYFKEPFANAIF